MMRGLAITGVAAASLTGAAFVTVDYLTPPPQHVPSAIVDHRQVPLPPGKFDRPYVGGLNVIRVPLAEVTSSCPRVVPDDREGATLFGCSYRFSTMCIIVIPEVSPLIPKAFVDKVKRHEIGHCNGWPPHHPDARYEK